MKKILAVILSLAMLAACVSACAEGDSGKVTLGTVSINGAFNLQVGIPEGYYTPTPLFSSQEHVIAQVTSEDPEKPMMILSVSFDETWSDVQRMNELDTEALEVLENTYTENDPTVEISYGETGLGTLLLIAKQTESFPNYMDFLSIYKGYFVEFLMTKSSEARDQTLSDEDMMLAIDFLTDLDFAEASEADILNQANSNRTSHDASIGAWDPEKQQLEVTVKIPVIFDETTLDEELAVGATVNLWDFDLEITSFSKENGYYDLNNGEYTFSLNEEDGLYHLYQDDYPILSDIYTGWFSAAPDFVFEDRIDPESLEPLDTPTEHTFEGFIAMLESESTTGIGPGFASNNVEIVINGDDQLSRVVRFYTPWQ